MQRQAILLSALLAVSLVGAAVVPAASQQASGEAYSGSHVEFDSSTNAVTDYSVDGAVVVENVTMRSESAARSESDGEGGLGVGVGASVDLPAAAIESRSEAAAGVRLGFESGGEMRANDNRRGVAQFRADGESQVVTAELASSAEAESESDERVVVTKDDGTQGAFIVVGDGNVTAENGSVMAQVESDSQLVYRQYDEERSESDEQQERMIQNGTATAEVFVRSTTEAEGDDMTPADTETVEESTPTATATPTATETATPADAEAEGNATSVVTYDQDTEIDVTSRSSEEINATVERTESDGKVVIMTVANESFENTEDLEVYVDGEAAAQADSYSEVEQSARDGEEPSYLVQQSSSASAATDVVVGIDHFSERQVSMQSGEDGESGGDDGGSGDDGSSGDGAGFGALVALVALAAALVAGRLR